MVNSRIGAPLVGWSRGIAAALFASVLTACGGGGGVEPPLPPPVIAQQPASVSVQAGVTATFSVTLLNPSGATYQWLRNGADVPTASLPSLVLASPTVADTGSRWSVRVSNPGGTVTSAEAVLTVTPAPIITPLGISLLAGSLGDVTAAGVNAAGDTLLAHYEPSGSDFNLIARRIGSDGSLAPVVAGGPAVVVGTGRAPNPLLRQTGAAFDADGNLYVATTTYQYFEYTIPGTGTYGPTGGYLSRFAPNGTSVRLVDWPAGSAGAVAPDGLAIGADGALYLVDFLTGNLIIWSPQSGVRKGPLVSNRFARDGYPGTHIVVKDTGTIYVMDRGLLKRVEGSAVTLIAGKPTFPILAPPQGQYGVAGTADGTGTAAAFYYPTSMTIDAAGNLYVADGAGIRKVTPAGVVATVAGIVARSPSSYTPLQTGPLPGALGYEVAHVAMGPDGVLHAFVYPNAASYPELSPNQRGEQSLVKIKFE